MKTDLATSIGAAILGLIVGYFVTNVFLSAPEEVKYKTIDSASLTSDLAVPSEGVFNYLALDPTVEVYVGSCTEFDTDGNCMSDPNYMYNILNAENAKEGKVKGYYYDPDTGELIYTGEDEEEDEEEDDEEEESFTSEDLKNALKDLDW